MLDEQCDGMVSCKSHKCHIVNGKLRKKAGPSFTALGKRKD